MNSTTHLRTDDAVLTARYLIRNRSENVGLGDDFQRYAAYAKTKTAKQYRVVTPREFLHLEATLPPSTVANLAAEAWAAKGRAKLAVENANTRQVRTSCWVTGKSASANCKPPGMSQISMHRLAALVSSGRHSLPAEHNSVKLDVYRRCGNPRCCRPSHLAYGPRIEALHARAESDDSMFVDPALHYRMVKEWLRCRNYTEVGAMYGVEAGTVRYHVNKATAYPENWTKGLPVVHLTDDIGGPLPR